MKYSVTEKCEFIVEKLINSLISKNDLQANRANGENDNENLIKYNLNEKDFDSLLLLNKEINSTLFKIKDGFETQLEMIRKFVKAEVSLINIANRFYRTLKKQFQNL